MVNCSSINGDFFFYFWPQNYHYNIEQVNEKSWRCKKMKFWSKFVLCTWTILQKLVISTPKMMLKGSLLIVLWQHIVMSYSIINQVFTGNTDQNTVQKNNVENLPRTKFIRFRPTEVHNWATLRVEIYGAAQGSSYFYLLQSQFTSMYWTFFFVEMCMGWMNGQLNIFMISVV